MLMTASEESRSRIRHDGHFFRQGLPAVISLAVEKTWAEPFMLARRVFGENLERFLEPAARLMGTVAGMTAKPLFAALKAGDDHVLEDTMKATRIAENITGIYGSDYYVDPKKIVRRIHTCPYRNNDGARVLCHIGESAGQDLFKVLVPGTRHKVHVTMARGHAFCEYSYEID